MIDFSPGILWSETSREDSEAQSMYPVIETDATERATGPVITGDPEALLEDSARKETSSAGIRQAFRNLIFSINDNSENKE